MAAFAQCLIRGSAYAVPRHGERWGSHAIVNKDKSIWGFLAQLAAVTDTWQWQVTDHWEGDRMAVGLTRLSTQQPLIYVSTYNLPAGRYFYECEKAAPEGDEAQYVTVSQADDVDFLTLVTVIREHLGLDTEGNPEG